MAPYYQGQALPYGSSAAALIAGLLLLILAIAMIGGGAWLFTQGNAMGRFATDFGGRLSVQVIGRLSREELTTMLSALPAVLIVIGVIQLVVSVGVFAHKGWGRWLGVLLSLLGVIVAIPALTTALAIASGVSAGLIVAIVLLVGYVLALLGLLFGGGHFRRRSPAPR